MSIVLFENWNHGTFTRWNQINPPGLAVVEAGVQGLYGRSLRIFSTASEFNQAVQYVFPSTMSEAMISFALMVSQLPATSNFRILSARNGGTHQVGLYLNANGSLSVSRNTSVLLTTSTNIVTLPNYRYRIELGFSIHGSTGTIVLRVNGVEHLSQIALNTRNGVDGFDNIYLGSHRSTGSNTNCFYDDVLVDSDKTAFLGDFYGQSLLLDADLSTDSTPSTGSDSWSLLNVRPHDTSSYTAFTAPGEDTFGVTDLDDAPDTIHAVIASVIASTDGAGTCEMRTKITSDASVDVGTTETVNATSNHFQQIVMLDPDGSVPWTPAAVNALTLSVERVS